MNWEITPFWVAGALCLGLETVGVVSQFILVSTFTGTEPYSTFIEWTVGLLKAE